jgi:hypothetical protein
MAQRQRRGPHTCKALSARVTSWTCDPNQTVAIWPIHACRSADRRPARALLDLRAALPWAARFCWVRNWAGTNPEKECMSKSKSERLGPTLIKEDQAPRSSDTKERGLSETKSIPRWSSWWPWQRFDLRRGGSLRSNRRQFSGRPSLMNKGCSTAAGHPPMLFADLPRPRLQLPTHQKSAPR